MKKIGLLALAFLAISLTAFSQERVIRRKERQFLNRMLTCNCRVEQHTHWVKQILWI